MKTIAAALLGAFALFGQQGSSVNQVQGPTNNNGVSLYYYNGSNQITYICWAPSNVTPTTYTIGATPGFTQIVVAANVGTITFSTTAYLWVGQSITVAGFATTALNGTYIVTAVSGSTATITTSGVSNATYNDSGATITTSGPVLNAAVWNVQVFTYSGGYLATSYYAGGGTAPSQGKLCSARATY